MSGAVYGAELSQAFGSMDTIEPIEIYSADLKLVGKNWQVDPTATPEEQVVARQLFQTAHTITQFFWENFRICGTDQKGKLPPFIIGCKTNETSFSVRVGHHPELFRFANLDVLSPEVVAHEYMHAVVYWLNPLGSSGESGALNEALADVFGIAFKHAQGLGSDWRIADRDLSALFRTKDVRRIAKADEAEANDYGEVHHNSLVISHGFYLATQALLGDEKTVLKIWLHSLVRLDQQSLAGFVAKTIAVAGETGSPYEGAMRDAWRGIGFRLPGS